MTDGGVRLHTEASADQHGGALTASSPRASDDMRAALHELDLLGKGRLADLDKLVMLALDICGGSLAVFVVHDADTAHEVSSSFEAAVSMPREECMCSLPLELGVTVQVADAAADPRFARTRHVFGPPNVRSFIGVPVGAESGCPVGVLAVGHNDPGRFGAQEAARLEKTAELVAAFLSHRRAANRAMHAATRTEAERTRQGQFELIFNAMNEGVNVFDATGRIIESNPASVEILGLTRDQQFGRSVTDPRWRTTRPDGSPFPPEEYPVARTLRSGEIVRDVGMAIDLHDGSRRWISLNAVPVRDPRSHAIAYVVSVFRDVTAQRDAEAQLTVQNGRLGDALEAAEKASRAKTDFMAVLSHELRTPMNAVMSCALLLSQSRLDPVQRRTLGVLEDASKQMLVVLNDLLDLAALNADKVRIQPEPVSLLRLIEDAAVIWAADVRAKGLSLSVIIDPALSAPRSADSARVLQIIGNLVANAVKFTQQGAISLEAWPERGPGGAQCVVIEVGDTGPGVPAEAIERIFLPFEQIDVTARRRHGGLGLGLHIARQLAIAMGGDVTLETESGRGSRFTVRIAAPLTTEGQEQGVRAGEAIDAPVRSILCVDDNPRNLYVLGAMLRAAGHCATECASGEEALALMARQKFDAVLLDMVMPEMDGLDVLARLRAGTGPNAATPVIACTANVLPDQVESYRKAGTAGVLAKPIDVRAMLRAVADAV
jgi:PAS domain S-box-containing protein